MQLFICFSNPTFQANDTEYTHKDIKECYLPLLLVQLLFVSSPVHFLHYSQKVLNQACYLIFSSPSLILLYQLQVPVPKIKLKKKG